MSPIGDQRYGPTPLVRGNFLDLAVMAPGVVPQDVAQGVQISNGSAQLNYVSAGNVFVTNNIFVGTPLGITTPLTPTSPFFSWNVPLSSISGDGTVSLSMTNSAGANPTPILGVPFNPLTNNIAAPSLLELRRAAVPWLHHDEVAFFNGINRRLSALFQCFRWLGES